MGFVLSPKTYTLNFEGQGYDGLQVIMRGLPLRNYLEVQRLQGSEDAESTEKLMRVFVESVVSWNLEQITTDGVSPVPVTYEGLSELDLDFVLVIIGNWMTAVAGVPAPLDENSDAGKPSPVESTLMAASTVNLPS
jgi:hypothetical protein